MAKDLIFIKAKDLVMFFHRKILYALAVAGVISSVLFSVQSAAPRPRSSSPSRTTVATRIHSVAHLDHTGAVATVAAEGR